MVVGCSSVILAVTQCQIQLDRDVLTVRVSNEILGLFLLSKFISISLGPTSMYISPSNFLSRVH